MSAADSHLTAYERSGRTRRARTREQIEAAIVGLLKEQPYDDIRAAHIIERAGVGAATFYQAAGTKGRAVAQLVAREIMTMLEGHEPDDAGAAEDGGIESLLCTLGTYGERHPDLAIAFCRAYFKDVAGRDELSVKDHPAQQLVDETQRRLERFLRRTSQPYLFDRVRIAPHLMTEALLAHRSHPMNDLPTQHIDDLIRLIHLQDPAEIAQ